MKTADLSPALQKRIRDLESEYRTICETEVKREQDAFADYRRLVAQEVALAEKDAARLLGDPAPFRFNRLRSVLRIEDERPKPRRGLCRFGRPPVLA